MFHRVNMDVIKVMLVIRFVSNYMIPESMLPDIECDTGMLSIVH